MPLPWLIPLRGPRRTLATIDVRGTTYDDNDEHG